jgi:hypothetical protein
MNKTQIISTDAIKTVCQGALGAMTFGAYHQFTTNKIMELNNEKIDIQNKYIIDKMENQYKTEIENIKTLHKNEIDEINKKLEKIMEMKKNNWFW